MTESVPPYPIPHILDPKLADDFLQQFHVDVPKERRKNRALQDPPMERPRLEDDHSLPTNTAGTSPGERKTTAVKLRSQIKASLPLFCHLLVEVG